MDLGLWKEPRKDEALEFLIKWTKPYLPQYWYDVLGLSVVGLAAISGGVVALSIQNPLSGLILAIGGISKAPVYMIGHAVSEKRATVIGEVLTGAFAGAALGLALYIGA